MSGTSMDGLDAAVAQLEWDGSAVAMSPLRHIERPWPDEVRERLHGSLGSTTAGELCELDQLIGQASAELATELLPADLVVSHGQTVYHWVQDGEAKGTLQLGQPAWIVEKRCTGLPVLSDVRARDIAARRPRRPLAGTSETTCGYGASNARGAQPGRDRECDNRPQRAPAAGLRHRPGQLPARRGGAPHDGSAERRGWPARRPRHAGRGAPRRSTQRSLLRAHAAEIDWPRTLPAR